MTRLKPPPTPALYAGIFAVAAVTLALDFATPLGIAIWILYLIPVTLTFFVWRPLAPFLAAAIGTGLMVLTYFTDAPFAAAGVTPMLTALNRSFGAVTMWSIAYCAHVAIQNRLAVRRLEWIQTSKARLSLRMAGDQRLDELSQAVLDELAAVAEAHAGAVYLAEGEGFRRYATYAVPSADDVPERFASGQGLLGQAAKERRPLVLSPAPDGYLKVGSALGKATPPSILVAPFLEGETVHGVVELAFLRPVEEPLTALAERISEPVAIAIRTARFRERLQELHEETQAQNEELQAQSEELRVSNEELAEQGRALKESQARLENQQAELEQTNTQLEEQAQRLEQQRTALEERTQELDQTSRYKSDFLANMSHELRTPLNSSLILSKLLADNRSGNLTDEQVQYAQTIHSAGNDLLTLINDVLDLSKIEAGHMEAHPEPTPLDGLIRRLNGTFRPLAEQKGIALSLVVDPSAPAQIVTDAQRLEQILKNLLSNAIKFTERGEVALRVSRTGAGDRDGSIAFAVHDSGIGIPLEQQAIVFEAFRQSDSTTSRKYGGTGLGLSITRRLVELLGGRIDLQSEIGKGSAFTVTLPERFGDEIAVGAPSVRPAAPAPSPMPPKPNPAALRRHRFTDDRELLRSDARTILIVEDDESFAKILVDLAHEQGFQALAASSADEGLALAAQFSPSAVILDVGLPDHSGLSVLDRLKHDARTRHIPVHVVSAGDYAHTALALGAAGYMLKPVKREELESAFAHLETRLTQKLRRVLLVEDDEVQLESLRLLLGSQDVETVGARTAAACLDALRSATFDCMVLDLSLPDASGFELLETLSGEDRYAFPPVIVYTGRELSADEEQRLRRYSKSIIVKGAKSPERLLDEVTLFLHQVVTDLPDEQQRMLERARDRDAALEDRQILIAEDDVRNVFALTSILEPKGAKVRIARNGREALSALEATRDGSAPPVDLVLMDVMMPEMDGLAAMREIRKRAEWKRLPIIALTAKAMKDDQEECIAAGANDYMAKPLDVEKLLSLIRVWLPR